jgi:hypothetical protein
MKRFNAITSKSFGICMTIDTIIPTRNLPVAWRMHVVVRLNYNYYLHAMNFKWNEEEMDIWISFNGFVITGYPWSEWSCRLRGGWGTTRYLEMVIS